MVCFTIRDSAFLTLLERIHKMRKFSLVAGLLVSVIGLSAVSTTSSAFAAGCLPNQNGAALQSLTNDTMVPNAGAGPHSSYDVTSVQGNSCSVTQQSAPVQDVKHAKKAQDAYN
jgi:hypothetical protein